MALSRNTQGALLMALAMAGFTFNDALTKTLTDDLNVGQLMMVRGAIMTVLVYFLARHVGALVPLRTLMQPMVLLRVALECLATIAFLLALGQLPLSNISAIMQSLPLAVTLGAALFLGEPVGWHRWSAIIVGFAGILLIIRPGPEGFTLASLLALVSVFGAGARDLATKRIDSAVPSFSVTLLTAIAATVVGAMLVIPMGGWRPLDMSTLSVIGVASVMLLVGHQSIVMAMRTAEDVSFIAPLRYTSLLWAVGIGLVFLGESLNPLTALGAFVVIGSGLYTFYREKKRKTSQRLAQQSRPGSPL